MFSYFSASYMYASHKQLVNMHINSLLINSRIIVAYSKTCKLKRKPNWMQEQLLFLAQLVYRAQLNSAYTDQSVVQYNNKIH